MLLLNRKWTENACRGLVRLPSTVAVSFSETNTRQSTSSNHRSTPSSIPLRSDTRKKSSHTRFSCYVKSHQTSKDASKKVNQKRPIARSELRSQNNNHHCDGGHRMSIASPKKILKLTQHCRANLCNSCSKLIQTNVTQLSSTLLCQTCLHLIRSSNQLIAVKPVGLSKADEKELRHIIEGVVEEFQDQFGQALNLSIKQLSQHLLSNINLFYSHYQQEFEQLTKKYRLTFLERFVQLMNKCQTKSNSSIQAIKPSVSHRVIPAEQWFLWDKRWKMSFDPFGARCFSGIDHASARSFIYVIVEWLIRHRQRSLGNACLSYHSIEFHFALDHLESFDKHEGREESWNESTTSIYRPKFIEENVHTK